MGPFLIALRRGDIHEGVVLSEALTKSGVVDGPNN